jgi:hypothetical protein
LHAGGNSNSPVIFAGADSGDVTYTFRQSRGTITSPSDTGGEGVRLSFQKRATSAWASPIAQIYAAGDGSGSDGYLEFLTKPSGGSATPRARIDSSGRLLIGTSSAIGNYALQIQANNASDPFEGAILLRRGLSNAALDDDGYGLGSIAAGSQTNVGGLIEFLTDGAWGSGDYPTSIVFSTTADGASSPTERMRITNGGLIDIGGLYSVGANAIRFDVQGSNFSRDTTGSATHIFFVNPNGGVGSITTNGSATAYNTSSDYRLKENVAPLTGAIDRLNDLQVHRFNFIADPDKTVDGFIAHEAQTVVPECVTGTKDEVDENGNPVYQGIDQSKLVPLLTAALQEALQKIEDLEGRLTAAGL